jgi:hypothetical protein
MVQIGTRRHQEQMKKAGKKLKRKDCGKKEDTGVFNFINPQGWTVRQKIWSSVLWHSEPRITVLARTSSNIALSQSVPGSAMMEHILKSPLHLSPQPSTKQE